MTKRQRRRLQSIIKNLRRTIVSVAPMSSDMRESLFADIAPREVCARTGFAILCQIEKNALEIERNNDADEGNADRDTPRRQIDRQAT